MDTMSRLNALCLQLNRPAVRSCLEQGPAKGLHKVLDDMDKLVGIKTRHGCASAYTQGAKPFPVSEYVGARLARLERHVEASKAPAMFWLGAEGDSDG